MAPLPSGNYKATINSCTLTADDFAKACSVAPPPNNAYFDFDSFFQSLYAYPKVKRVVYHEPATIVFWTDDTKTVVKCIDGQPYEKYAGFCAAVTKKVFGGTSTAKKIAGAKDKPVKIKVEEPVSEEPIVEELVAEESVEDEVVVAE